MIARRLITAEHDAQPVRIFDSLSCVGCVFGRACRFDQFSTVSFERMLLEELSVRVAEMQTLSSEPLEFPT